MIFMLNRWCGIGHVATDVTYGDNNKHWAFFKIACDRKAMRKDGRTADLIPVMCEGDIAIQARDYLQKGRFVYVEGEVRVKEYKGADVVEIEASFIRFLDAPPQGRSRPEESSSSRAGRDPMDYKSQDYNPYPQEQQRTSYRHDRYGNARDSRQNRTNSRSSRYSSYRR